MIGYIKGTAEDFGNGYVIIENGGVGYKIKTTQTSPVLLSVGTGETVIMYTEMIVREDDVSLYGFTDKESLAMFELLLTVSGVGAKAALAILSVLTAGEVADAVRSDDALAVSRANGVGKKIAQRVVLELKDKVDCFASGPAKTTQRPTKKSEVKEQALGALIALGWSRAEAADALSSVPDEGLSVEETIREALRNR